MGPGQIEFGIELYGQGQIIDSIQPKSLGGKSASLHLLKPVKSKSKRADLLRYFLEAPRTVEEAMGHFGISRQNVFAHWTALHREHGIGYLLDGANILPRLPAACDARELFK